MKLRDLLTTQSVPNIEISGISEMSGNVQVGDLFLALGDSVDQRTHIAEAKDRGAVCVLTDKPTSLGSDSLDFPIQLNQYDMFSSNSDRYTSTLFNGAFQFSLKANFPINERLIFSVYNQFSMQCYVKLNEDYDLSPPSTYINFQSPNLASYPTVIDPNIPLLDIQTLSDFILLPSSRWYIGLRYSFGEKKNDVEVPEE